MDSTGAVIIQRQISLKENLMEKCKLYTLSTCGHCKSCKKFLSESGVEFEYTDVDLLPEKERSQVLDQIKKLTSRCAFPTIILGDKVIVGFKENDIREALGL
jgi:glutaredoxin-like protein NrdH